MSNDIDDKSGFWENIGKGLGCAIIILAIAVFLSSPAIFESCHQHMTKSNCYEACQESDNVTQCIKTCGD